MENKGYTEEEAKEIMRGKTADNHIVVGNLQLKNQGGFVVKMDFVYLDDNMDKKRVSGSEKNIALGQSEKCDPGNYKVPDGAIVTVHVDVVAGKDKVGTSWFQYQKGNPHTANFVISGTTLDNELGLVDIT